MVVAAPTSDDRPPSQWPPYAAETLTSIAAPEGIPHAAGYLEAVERCRERFPELRILSGAELGEPHRHPDQIQRVLSAGPFDLLLGSLHSLPDRHVFAEPCGIYPYRDAHEVMREYLAGVVEMVSISGGPGAGRAAAVLRVVSGHG